MKKKNKLGKNKAVALLFIIVSAIESYFLCDITMLIFAIVLGVPLFIAKEDWIGQ